MPHTITTRFLPSVHGFRFPNAFRNIFGAINTYGRCNGMTWIALDYFNAGRSAPAISAVDFERPIDSGLAAAITPGGVVQLFAWRMGENRALVGKSLRSRAFTDWGTCVNGSASLTPAACCWGPNRTDVLTIGNNNQLFLASYEGPVLSDLRRDCAGWLPGFLGLGGRSDRQPAMASPFANRLELYHVGLDDRALWFRYYQDGWHDWCPMGRPLDREITSGCAAAAQVGFMAGYVRGADNAMWERVWEQGGWQPWRPVGGGGPFTSGPAAASPGPGRVELFGRGADGTILWATRMGRAWSRWSSLGAPPGGAREEAPAAVARPGLLELFVRGNDGKVWRRSWQNGGPLPWEAVETAISSDSKKLTDAIYGKMMTTTVTPLVLATAPFGIGLLFLGPVRNYVTWRTPSNELTFRWTVTDELRKLRDLLSMGRPIPLGLIGFEGWGHEVVAYGLECDSNLPPGSFDPPGDFAYSIRVYDPNHPGCDDVRISFHGRDLRRSPITETAPAIRSSTGEIWRGCFVRDDYRAEPPPL